METRRTVFILLSALVRIQAAAVLRAPPAVQHIFTRATCEAAVSKNLGSKGTSYFGDIVLNTSNFDCLDGIGIDARGVEGWPVGVSTGNISALRTAILSTTTWPGLTFEFWLTLGSISRISGSSTYGNHAATILAFDEESDGSNDECGFTSQLEIVYNPYYTRTEFRLFSETDWLHPCLRFDPFSQWKNRQDPLHYVVTLEEETLDRDDDILDPTKGTFEWFFDGEYIGGRTQGQVLPYEMATLWTDDLQLTILERRRDAYRGYSQPFPGNLFSFAIYDYVLNDTEILSLYNDGAFDSIPRVYDHTVYVPEDGVTGQHYEDPYYYRKVVQTEELFIFEVVVIDADGDPDFPNYGKNVPEPTLFLKSLPSVGDLYNSSDYPILSVPFEVLHQNGTFPLKFRPRANEESTADGVYTSFKIYAIDNVLGTRSVNDATVSINVVPHNDPPIAFNGSQLVYAGTKENIIELNGSDPDVGDFIAGGRIAILPPQGQLYQVRTTTSSKHKADVSSLAEGEYIPL